MLEKTGLRVRILRMQGAKDPDEFLHKFGPDRFRLLLEGAENQMEYRLQSLQRQYDLSQDGQKVEFLKAAAELLASVATPWSGRSTAPGPPRPRGLPGGRAPGDGEGLPAAGPAGTPSGRRRSTWLPP